MKKCDTVCITSLNEVTLCTICANGAKIKASYSSDTSLGVSQASQARATIMQSMENMLETWIENQVKRNLSENLCYNSKSFKSF
jgi:hypothetical protein